MASIIDNSVPLGTSNLNLAIINNTPTQPYVTSNVLSNVLLNYITSNALSNNLTLKQDKLISTSMLYGDGTNITNISYTGLTNKPTDFQANWNTTVINKPTDFQANWNTTVINKPTDFQANWNTTVINKPDLTVYALTSSLSNFAKIPALSNFAVIPSLSNFATTSALSNFATITSLQPYINYTALNSCNYITNATSGLVNYPSYTVLNSCNFDTIALRNTALVPYINYTALNSCNYITNATSGLVNYPSYTVLNSCNFDTIALRNQALANYPNISTVTNQIASSLLAYSTTEVNNSIYLRLDGSKTMANSLKILSAINQYAIDIQTTDSTSINCIYLKNNNATTTTAFIGLAGTTYGGYYQNNLFLQTTNSIIFNSGNVTSTGTPKMIIMTNGNVGIGTTNATNIFQVGSAGRLRIGSGTTDYSLIGTLDTDGATNTKIVVSGNTRTSFAGNIEYCSTSTGSHIFYTTNTNVEKMRLYSTGNLNVNTIVNDRGLYDHSTAPLTITHQLPTSNIATYLNDPQPVLNICRQGTSGVAYGARATFNLSRYENNGVNSRTRMDISMAHSGYDNINVMTLYSGGTVGIGTTNPTQKLHIDSGALYITGNAASPASSSSASFWNQAGVGPTIAGANFSVQTGATPIEQFKIESSGNGFINGYFYAGGLTNGIRINGVDTGNTFYQDKVTINGNAGNIGFTLRDNNSFKFQSYSSANVYTTMAEINMNSISLNRTVNTNANLYINNNGQLIFNNNLDDMRIKLWDGYGFGINPSTLRYNSGGNHKFYANNNPTMNIDGSGNVSCTGTLTTGGDLSIGNGLIYLPKPGNSLGTLKLGLGGTTGADDTTNMKIEMQGAYNSGGEAGNMIIRTYAHLKIYSAYYTPPQMFINGQQARIGLGTATPDARLHVTAGVSSAFGNDGVSTWLGNIGIINSGGAGLVYWGNTFSSICAIFDTNVWSKSNIFASSDIRIKKEIEDINDTSALEKILQIQPKTYKYIDTLFKKSHTVIGFIAQQVQEVIPEAVEIQEEYIPNVFKIATTNQNIINLDNTEILKVNDDIKIYDKNGNPETSKIVAVNETSIEIDKSYEDDDVFIYGSKVKDFHTLDKSYIYTLNVCSTQELYKLIMRQQQQIDFLMSKLNI